jgi:hypothetical protein
MDSFGYWLAAIANVALVKRLIECSMDTAPLMISSIWRPAILYAPRNMSDMSVVLDALKMSTAQE